MGVYPLFIRSTMAGMSMHRPAVAEPLVFDVCTCIRDATLASGIMLAVRPTTA